MTPDQIILFALIGVIFVFLIWGKIRYDVVAFAALVVAFLAGVIPKDQVFSGFGHPAVVIIALVLIVSRGLSRSGAIELIAKRLLDSSRGIRAHVGLMGAVSAVLSCVMNNVAALALLMPVDLQAARRAKRSPALTLMPLSFASILGGMVTLIGTPPNIVIATYREQALGESYRMFDFAPVGIVVAIVGVIYLTVIGWRFIPVARREHDSGKELEEVTVYVAEAKVSETGDLVGRPLGDLDALAEENDVEVVGLVRRGARVSGRARNEKVLKSDLVLVEGEPDAIDRFIGSTGLDFDGPAAQQGLASKALEMVEVVVPQGARIEGRSAFELRLRHRQGITLLGISRRGRRLTERVRKARIRAGDILLLLGPEDRLGDVVDWLGCLSLAQRGLEVTQRRKAGLAVGIFAAAILISSVGLVYLPLALAAVAVLYVLLRVVSVNQIYESVEWSVIVLLGSMIPIGMALESSGGTAQVASGIVNLTSGLPPIMVLTILMIVTMSLSDVLNNVATALIAAPIGVDIAQRLDANPDTFLMAVAVAASCAFLTPIGHKNNTIIMGPGGYKFGDYWRMGLPLEILVVVVSIPVLTLFWPL